jgi:uncharacterized membrane protein YkoI
MNSLRFRFIGLSLIAVCLCVSLAIADGDDEQKGKGKGKGKGKSEIVQVDLSKLHPGIAQYIRDHLQGQGEPKGKDEKKGKGEQKKGKDEKKGKGDEKKGKGETKKGGMEIGLSDAIRIAEKTGHGTATKAERRKDKDEPPFRVELRNTEGVKTTVSIDAAGQILKTDLPKKKKKD